MFVFFVFSLRKDHVVERIYGCVRDDSDCNNVSDRRLVPHVTFCPERSEFLVCECFRKRQITAYGLCFIRKDVFGRAVCRHEKCVIYLLFFGHTVTENCIRIQNKKRNKYSLRPKKLNLCLGTTQIFLFTLRQWFAHLCI